MSQSVESPTPEFPTSRDALDSGSVGELATDAGQVVLPHTEALPWLPVHVDIEVPDDASALLTGLSDYGS